MKEAEEVHRDEGGERQHAHHFPHHSSIRGHHRDERPHHEHKPDPAVEHIGALFGGSLIIGRIV